MRSINLRYNVELLLARFTVAWRTYSDKASLLAPSSACIGVGGIMFEYDCLVRQGFLLSASGDHRGIQSVSILLDIL